MASFSGRDQDEDECSCDHAHDGGHLMGQGAPSEDTRAELALSLLHQEKGCMQAEPSLGSTFLPWASICPALLTGLLSKATKSEVS